MKNEERACISQSAIRCRAIILHEDKMLVVRHSLDAVFAALPGGHLEWGEDPRECVQREIFEELGVVPVVGRLLYVHTFTNSESKHSVEFLFEVTNGSDFTRPLGGVATHAHEIAEVVWVSTDSAVHILPERVASDFRAHALLSDSPRFFRVG